MNEKAIIKEGLEKKYRNTYLLICKTYFNEYEKLKNIKLLIFHICKDLEINENLINATSLSIAMKKHKANDNNPKIKQANQSTNNQEDDNDNNNLNDDFLNLQ